MPLESASSILNYKGDANLALGGNINVPVVGVGNTDQIMQTGRELAVNSFAKNRMLWEAKRQDLATARKAIDDGQVETGDVLEQDRQIVRDAKDNIWKVYDQVGGNITDPANYTKFKSAVNRANEISKQAQKKYLAVQGDLAEKKKTDNPYDQAKIDANIKSQLAKGFWGDYNPYAAITDFDLKTVQQPVTYGQVQTKRQGDYNVASQTLDVAKTFDNYQKQWALPQNREQFNRFVNDYFSHPNFQDDINKKNQVLEGINQRLGLKAGDKNYLTPIDPTKDRADQVAAKIAIADSEPVLEKKDFATQEINADLGRGRLAEEIRHNKASEGLQREQLNLSKQKADAKGIPSQFSTSATQDVAALMGKLRDTGILQKKGTSGKASWVITPDQINKLTDREKRMLGTATGNGTDWKLESLKLDAKSKEGLLIYEDGTIHKIKDVKRENGVTHYNEVGLFADQSQLFDNRLFDILQNTAGKEPSLTNEGLPYLYSQFQSRSSITPTPSFKESYVSKNGETYSLNDLKNKYGYSDEQLQLAIQAGTLK